MNEKMFYFGVCIVVLVFAATCSGCRSAPIVVGGFEEIGSLKSAYRELEERYQELERNHNELIERQREFTENYQAAADSIGSRVESLTRTGEAISGATDELDSNNRSVTSLLQQLISHYTGTKYGDSGPDEQIEDSDNNGSGTGSGACGAGDNFIKEEVVQWEQNF